MKQKDIALIAVIIFISAIASFFISKVVFAPPSKRQQQVDVVAPISPNFQTPSSAYFNSSSFDPTVPITTGQSNNTDPFSQGQ